MEAFGKNQKEIAAIIGVSAPTINGWLQALIKDAGNKKIDMVLVYKLDRLYQSAQYGTKHKHLISFYTQRSASPKFFKKIRKF